MQMYTLMNQGQSLIRVATFMCMSQTILSAKDLCRMLKIERTFVDLATSEDT